MHEAIRRKEATERTLKKYRSKAFDWQSGVTCIHMARTQMRAMGHKPPKMPRIRSAIGAHRALKERDCKTVGEFLGSLHPEIPPAQMLLGDLAVVEGDEELGSILICAGPLKLFGWREDVEGLVMMEVSLDQVSGAYRL